MHLSKVFIHVIHLYCQYVFPGNRTHNLCTANAMLHHWATGMLYSRVNLFYILYKSYFDSVLGCLGLDVQCKIWIIKSRTTALELC